MAAGDAEFDRRLRERLSLVAFVANRHVLHHMQRVSRELDMDLESAFLLGTLAHLNVLSHLRPGVLPSEALRADGIVAAPPVPVRLSQLTAVCGLPRETVRRRLLVLQEAGKVQRTAHGQWIASERGVDQRMLDFTRGTVLSLLAAADRVRELLGPDVQPSSRLPEERQ